MHEWLQSTLVKLPKKSPVTTAIGYALGLWPALLRFCDDGQLEVDNNAAERALRAVALGRNHGQLRVMYSGPSVRAPLGSSAAPVHRRSGSCLADQPLSACYP